MAFKQSISGLFKNADLKFKLKIIQELFIDVTTPQNSAISAYDEFDLNTGYFKAYWNKNSVFNSNEQIAIISLAIKNEKALNGLPDYLIIKKLFNPNLYEFNDDKVVFQSLGFKTETILEALSKEMNDLEFKNLLIDNLDKMVLIDSDKQHINDPFKKKIFQNICHSE